MTRAAAQTISRTGPGAFPSVYVFLLVPVDGPTSYFTIPSRNYLRDLGDLAKRLDANIVERFKCRVGPLGPIRYAWVDEEGHCKGRALNWRMSHNLYPGLLAGPVAIELGLFSAAEPHKWDKFAARLGREIWGTELPSEVPL